ncbi:MAG: adenine-specific methyltransferase EcoRI family protein [Clostridia bacterium]|nr:adenine-specific methyltransferase EcoRI family protein [Clostridia bacterium]
MDIDLQLKEKKSMQEFSLKKYCNGIMGVPITFLDKYNPEQFEILGLDDHRVEWRGRGPDLNGKSLYRRIIVRRKHDEN